METKYNFITDDFAEKIKALIMGSIVHYGKNNINKDLPPADRELLKKDMKTITDSAIDIFLDSFVTNNWDKENHLIKIMEEMIKIKTDPVERITNIKTIQMFFDSYKKYIAKTNENRTISRKILFSWYETWCKNNNIKTLVLGKKNFYEYARHNNLIKEKRINGTFFCDIL